VQARFTQATAVFDRIDRTGEWTFTKVGDTGEQTDWQRYHRADGLTRAGGQLAVTGSGDINTQYKCIGAAIITMQQAGFQRVGFISEPPPNGAINAAR